MIVHWTRPTTTRSVGSIVLLLAFLLTLASFPLQTTLNDPVLLLMQAPLAKPDRATLSTDRSIRPHATIPPGT